MSRLFELRFTLPIKKLSVCDPILHQAIQHLRQQWGPTMDKDLIDISTHMRAWDAKSYHFARYLVKKNVFGLINQKHFTWIDVNDRSVHEYNAETVSSAFGTKPGAVRFTTKQISVK